MDIWVIICHLLLTVPHAISGSLANRVILDLIRNSLCLTLRKGGGTRIPQSWRGWNGVPLQGPQRDLYSLLAEP